MKLSRLFAALAAAAAVLFASGCGQTTSPTTGFQRLESSHIYSLKYYPDTQTLTIVFVGEVVWTILQPISGS